MIAIRDKKLKNMKFIDLFCGIGGFHLALESFGAECVFASDIDKQAINIYEKNFRIKVSGDITKIKPQDIPEHDIICAGFPCQPFSISGKKQGFNDPNGLLYKQIIRIAKYHHPKLIIMENVKNLESHNKGETLKKILQDFDKAGYVIKNKVLNASDFGIPQARKRLYIVAFRNDIESSQFKFPDGDSRNVKLKDILVQDDSRYDVFINKDYTLTNHKINKNNKLIRIGEIGKGRQGERIYSINGHASTLSNQGGGVGGKTGMYIVNNKLRKLYPRECSRLMGFPDSFILPETLNTNYCLFGNSIVVDVIQAILLNINI